MLPTVVPLPKLEFFNGTGGFDQDGREYVTILQDGQTTPAPWINVIANPRLRLSGLGRGQRLYLGRKQPRKPVDARGRTIRSAIRPARRSICRISRRGQIWTPTALPIRTKGSYIARHGFGYSSFQHTANGIEADMVQFVPLDAPVKITRLTLRNTSGARAQAVGHGLCRMGAWHLAQCHVRRR